MGPDSDQSVIPAERLPSEPVRPDRGSGPGRHSMGTRRHRRGETTDLVPPPRWMTVLAFTVVIIPFGIILARLAFASGHVYLPDDLALIDLHTRRALLWKQQLGVFDHNGWNHPGPTYFYLLSLVYRVFGSGAKAMFFGATLINALAALACVGVVRRRATPARALWAAIWVCALASLLATVGPGSITYSEGAPGGLVSPWNPMVVIFPLLLFLLLCAAAFDRSPLSMVGALLVGSFIVQTNISALALVVATFVVALVVEVVTVVTDRRGGRASGITPSRRAWGWGIAGAVAFVLMWLPPVIQQLTNSPGNLTLIYRFFTAAHPVPSLAASVRSVVSVYGVLLVGPSEVMSSYLGHTPHHVGLAITATVVSLAVGVGVTVVGIRQRNRFAVGLGGLSLVGFVAMVFAVSRVVGDVYGYLVVWAIAVPFAALIGAGMVQWSPLTAAAPSLHLPAICPGGRLPGSGGGLGGPVRAGGGHPLPGLGLGPPGRSAGVAGAPVVGRQGAGLRQRRWGRNRCRQPSSRCGEVRRPGQSPRPGGIPAQGQPLLGCAVRSGLRGQRQGETGHRAAYLDADVTRCTRLPGTGGRPGSDRHHVPSRSGRQPGVSMSRSPRRAPMCDLGFSPRSILPTNPRSGTALAMLSSDSD